MRLIFCPSCSIIIISYINREVSKLNKRILAFLLALVMLFCASLAFAEDDDDEWFDDDDGFDEEEDKRNLDTVSGYDTGESFEDGDFFYPLTEDGKGAVLVKYSHNQSELVFPSTVGDNIPVVGIAIGLCACDPIVESIVIPGTVKTIPNRAFATCPNLKTIVLEEGVNKLDMCCFGGCENLESIQFPDSLEEVGNFAFAVCPKVKEIVFGTQLKTIGDQAFFQCEELSKVVIPGGDAVAIGSMAFDMCSENLQIVNN